jgi:predicted LPLAT superfamily acyltransferase
MLRLMTWITLTFGRRLSRGVLAGISLYFLLFAPSARRASCDYLRRALGRAPGWRDLYRHFHSFAGTIHDRVFLLNNRFDLYEIEVHGEDLLNAAMADGKGVLLMGAHMGSFDVVRALARQRPQVRVGMVMYEDNARKINAAMSAINPEARLDVVPLGHVDSMLQVRDRLDEGMVLGILGDRSLEAGPTRALPFLGAPAQFPEGPMRLAAMLRRPVIFMAGLYLGGNRYAIHFERLADFREVPAGGREALARAALESYVACLERHCRATPYNWFNFFDFWRPAAKVAK